MDSFDGIAPPVPHGITHLSDLTLPNFLLHLGVVSHLNELRELGVEVVEDIAELDLADLRRVGMTDAEALRVWHEVGVISFDEMEDTRLSPMPQSVSSGSLSGWNIEPHGATVNYDSMRYLHSDTPTSNSNPSNSGGSLDPSISPWHR